MSTHVLTHRPTTDVYAVATSPESRPYSSAAEAHGVAPPSPQLLAVRQGLMVICKRLVMATAAAAILAVPWMGPTNGSYGQRFGILLVILGFAMMATPAEAGTRTSVFRPATGLRERFRLSNGRSDRELPTLTGVGAFLFIAVPMITAGALLM